MSPCDIFKTPPAFGSVFFYCQEIRNIELNIKITFRPVVLVLCIALVFSGCSRGIPVEVIESGAKETIRQNLASAVETGSVGSEMILVEQGLERLASEDAAKANEVKKIYDELRKATTPAAVKAKAKEIIGKL